MLLSIVTPTRGNFSSYWFDQLTSIQGDVEFVLVYPPGQSIQEFSDSRIKIIVSPYKGEVIQRAIGSLNVLGDYVIALDDDDFLHPQITNLVKSYFELYPTSICLRLSKHDIHYQDTKLIERSWDKLPDIARLIAVETNYKENYAKSEILQEIPIAPLNNKFKLSSLWFYSRRTDQNGPHPENYNNKVWKRNITQEAVEDLLNFTQMLGPLTWIPFWSLDRLLGLYLQAQIFQQGIILGHWLHGGEQVRYIEVESSTKGEVRSMFAGDLLLALRFPRYGYFWNLFFHEMWAALKVFLKTKLTAVAIALGYVP
ncbi:MAG: glycosyltransferase family 2 protein [Alkalinema sp. CAN_BIN05]|nr:glycosyltransferase family 2 protein [Alkalinema sp. CAN_BIN05]